MKINVFILFMIFLCFVAIESSSLNLSNDKNLQILCHRDSPSLYDRMRFSRRQRIRETSTCRPPTAKRGRPLCPEKCCQNKDCAECGTK